MVPAVSKHHSHRKASKDNWQMAQRTEEPRGKQQLLQHKQPLPKPKHGQKIGPCPPSPRQGSKNIPLYPCPPPPPEAIIYLWGHWIGAWIGLLSAKSAQLPPLCWKTAGCESAPLGESTHPSCGWPQLQSCADCKRCELLCCGFMRIHLSQVVRNGFRPPAIWL